MTAIEWTDDVWNPTTGCDRVSRGCDHCYALTFAGRLKAMGQPKYQRDGHPATSGPGFRFTEHETALDAPMHWGKPRHVFVNSMSDLFHPDATDEFIVRVFDVMGNTLHTFQVLTKRPQRMATFVGRYYAGEFSDRLPEDRVPLRPFRRVWLGTSIENDRYTWRANYLRETPAAVRFVSLEPLLGPLPSLDLTDIDWVIVGAESGKDARPMEESWVRDLRDQAKDAGAAFFYKQRAVNGRKVSLPELDGRVWNEMPEVAGAA